MAVVVIVANRYAVAVSLGHLRTDPMSRSRPGRSHCRDSGTGGRRRPTVTIRPGWERTTLEHIDIEPAVAVEIDQADPATHVLRQLMLRGRSIVEDKAQARLAGIVVELDRRG